MTTFMSVEIDDNGSTNTEILAVQRKMRIEKELYGLYTKVIVELGLSEEWLMNPTSEDQLNLIKNYLTI